MNQNTIEPAVAVPAVSCVERKWVTRVGLPAFVAWSARCGHRSGYVAVSPRHPWDRVPWNTRPDDRSIVHGGVTYSDIGSPFSSRST